MRLRVTAGCDLQPLFVSLEWEVENNVIMCVTLICLNVQTRKISMWKELWLDRLMPPNLQRFCSQLQSRFLPKMIWH